MPVARNSIESPCNRVCTIHPRVGLCVGCGRSLDEIARWTGLSAAERSAVMALLPARLAALDGAAATAAQAG
jgi:predicted Fe-S protein YdhL (DUF1289 family)